MIKVILIDDDPHCLDALSNLLEKYCPYVRILEKCSSAHAVIEAIEKLKPSFTFPDIETTWVNGFEISYSS